MVHYIIVTSILTLLVLLTYKVFLERIKANRLKRSYLLVALPLIFIAPFIKLPTTIESLATTAALTETLNTITIANDAVTPTNDIDYLNLTLKVIYSIGVVFMLVRLVKQLYAIYFIKKTGSISKEGKQQVVYNHLIKSPFTFFSTIYLPLHHAFDLNNKIIQHELIHVKQKHSYDIMLIELIKVVFWFNPLFYYYKEHMALNHEFLADEQLFNTKEEQQSYLELLLNEIELSTPRNFVSTFNFNQTKKRFIMITQQKDKKQNRWMFFAATLFLTTTGLFSIACTSDNNQETMVDEKEITKTTTEDNVIAVKQGAYYPGGMTAFNKEFVSQLKLTKEDYKTVGDQKSIRIIVQFNIAENGTLNDIKIVKGHEYEAIAKKAVAVIKNMPKWDPAKENGKPTISNFTLPITIQVQ